MRDRSKHEESGKRIYGHQTMNSECRKRLHVPFSLSLSTLALRVVLVHVCRRTAPSDPGPPVMDILPNKVSLSLSLVLKGWLPRGR